MKLQNIIEKHWYIQPNIILSILLIIPCLIFFIISKLRYYLYKFNILKSYKLPIPVIIVGNISVGGVGKTPLTKMLAMELEARGKKVGIIMRGYKSTNSHPQIVLKDMNSSEVGDEALIYANSGLKVAIGKDRYKTGLKLVEAFPNLDIILADDGLQHYRLKRDFEIVVIDSTRLFGNNFVLPMGPLRETRSRLKSVNAVVINGNTSNAIPYIKENKVFKQQIILDKIFNPVTGTEVTPEYFVNKETIAMAAIGNPNRFFNLLANLNINPTRCISFPDHYHYELKDIPNNEAQILVTEKDYTKLTKYSKINIWVVLVKASLDNNILINQIDKLL